MRKPIASAATQCEVEFLLNKYAGKRLPYGTIGQLMMRSGTTKNQMNYILKSTKKKLGLVGARKSQILPKQEKLYSLVSMVRTLDIIRVMPNQNRVSSTKIINALQNKTPHGGSALFIGTQTPIAVSDSCNNNAILTDELEIAIALNMTTAPNVQPKIVVGNLISPEKALVKGMLWRSNNTTGSWPIKVGPVDAYSYIKEIVTMANEHPLTKVVLCTSGVWTNSKPTRVKYPGCDFNFKGPSEYLTKEFPNLHILAMHMNDGKTFKVIYLHNGRQQYL